MWRVLLCERGVQCAKQSTSRGFGVFTLERTEPSNGRLDWPLPPRASRGLAGYAGLGENPRERGPGPGAVPVDRTIPHGPSRIRMR